MYKMQIKLRNPSTGLLEWKSIRPTNGKPYEYKTRSEAEDMLEMCYPRVERIFHNLEARVVKIEAVPHTTDTAALAPQ